MRYAISVALWVAGCGSTGQSAVDFPVHASGADASRIDAGAWHVTIDEADLGLGPLYLCATAGASAELCEAARAEWRGSATVDLLDPSAQMLGEAQGHTGGIESALFDYGITWLLPDPMPRPTAGAPEGHSLALRGSATDGTRTIHFEALVDIDAQAPGQGAVHGFRTSHELTTEPSALVIRFDTQAWLQEIDFDAIAALDDGRGGAVQLGPGTQAYESLVVAMTSTALPRFEWSH